MDLPQSPYSVIPWDGVGVWVIEMAGRYGQCHLPGHYTSLDSANRKCVDLYEAWIFGYKYGYADAKGIEPSDL